MYLRFLLAQLHMTSLATKEGPKAIRKALKTLPEGLHGTYDEMMRRIESQNDDDKQLARRVLFWIFHALRPLTLGELQHALAVEPGELELDEGNIIDGELLASPCAGLVVADREAISSAWSTTSRKSTWSKTLQIGFRPHKQKLQEHVLRIYHLASLHRVHARV
jgi:hypothetical protein